MAIYKAITAPTLKNNPRKVKPLSVTGDNRVDRWIKDSPLLRSILSFTVIALVKAIFHMKQNSYMFHVEHKKRST
jgi:hypothetical protein